jgi:hypothetical protein
MAGPIKSVLREELQNSRRMKRAYEKELRKLPSGSRSIKRIKGHDYVYQVKRDGPHVRFVYKGKAASGDREKYLKAKEVRARYRKLLSQVKKQIRYLEGALRGREAI